MNVEGIFLAGGKADMPSGVVAAIALRLVASRARVKENKEEGDGERDM
jgi:hypothetical protein